MDDIQKTQETWLRQKRNVARLASPHYPSLRSRYVLGDVTRYLACRTVMSILEAEGSARAVSTSDVWEQYVYEYVFQWSSSS
jgi:hypothetical protein